LGNEQDSIEKIQRDLMALIERAISLGDKRAVARMMAVLGQDLQTTPHASNDTVSGINVPPAAPAPVRDGGRAPQGAVKNVVRDVVLTHPQGIESGDIDEFARRDKGVEIKASSRRMALLALKTAGDIVQRDGKWFPASKVDESGAATPVNLFDLQEAEGKPVTAR